MKKKLTLFGEEVTKFDPNHLDRVASLHFLAILD